RLTPNVTTEKEPEPSFRHSPVNNTAGQRDDGTSAEVWAGAEDEDPLVVDACRLDAEHWEKHQRPISAETLRRELRVGSRRSRALARAVRRRYEPGSAVLVAVS